jgi:hypothetical protein
LSDPQIAEDIGHNGGRAERQNRNDSDFPQMIFLDPDAYLGTVPYRFGVGSVSMIALDRSYGGWYNSAS